MSVQPPMTAANVGQPMGFVANLTVLPAGAAAPAIVWTSSDHAIATIASTGASTASAMPLRPGRTTITATAGGKSGHSALNVLAPPVTASRALAISATISSVPGGPENSEILALPPLTDATTNLTFDPSADRDPRWSPDGSQILFWTGRVSGGALFVVSAQGGTAQQVTKICGLCTRTFLWSPTTNRIHFLNYNSSDEPEGFYTIAPDGSGLQRIGSSVGLVPIGFPSSSVRDPVYSRDGSKIAYRYAQRIFVADVGPHPTARVVTPACTFPTTCDFGPVWSPNGQEIATFREGGLWISNVSTAQARRIADADASVAPTWSPDAAEIAYVHDYRLRVTNTTSGASQILASTFEPTSDAFGHIAWSSDGSLIAVKGASFVPAYNYGLFIVRRSDAAYRRVLPYAVIAVEWAPR